MIYSFLAAVATVANWLLSPWGTGGEDGWGIRSTCTLHGVQRSKKVPGGDPWPNLAVSLPLSVLRIFNDTRVSHLCVKHFFGGGNKAIRMFQSQYYVHTFT